MPDRADRPRGRSGAGAGTPRRHGCLHRAGAGQTKPVRRSVAHRADLIRKFGDFTDGSPALLRAAMSARLHAVLDALMGQGRVLLQEMALVKPPKVSGEKPWHQDAAYFRGSDPNMMFGVWIALDPATRENGCMEVIPGSHLRGPVPHVPAKDINLCTIRADLVRMDDRDGLPMNPGDVLIFHSLIHHYTAANRIRPAAAGRCSSTTTRSDWSGHRWRRIAGCTTTRTAHTPAAPCRRVHRSQKRPASCRTGCGRSCRWHRLRRPTFVCQARGAGHWR